MAVRPELTCEREDVAVPAARPVRHDGEGLVYFDLTLRMILT